ncbi:MAG: antibiotic biosynthesis monooxygenase [Actinomycetota bacterium]
MIIVTATLSFDTEAHRDAAVTASAPIQRATRDDEPGCLAYCFAADPAEPTHIQVYELWTDADRLAEHFDHPNYAAMVEVLGSSPGFLASDNRLWAADDRGPVYGDDRRFRADAVSDA